PGSGRQSARQDAGDLRIADGQFEYAQPQALPAVPRRQGERHAQGQRAHQGAGRNADGQRDARDVAGPWPQRSEVVRRQQRLSRPERGVMRYQFLAVAVLSTLAFAGVRGSADGSKVADAPAADGSRVADAAMSG